MQGEANRPLEAKDGGPVDVSTGQDGRREVAASDRSVVDKLDELLSVNRRILRALEIMADQEVSDEG